MKLRKRLAPLFVVLAAAVLALPVLSRLNQNPVSANAQKQVQAPAAAKQSQSDASAKTKQPKAQPPKKPALAPSRPWRMPRRTRVSNRPAA